MENLVLDLAALWIAAIAALILILSPRELLSVLYSAYCKLQAANISATAKLEASLSLKKTLSEKINKNKKKQTKYIIGCLSISILGILSNKTLVELETTNTAVVNSIKSFILLILFIFIMKFTLHLTKNILPSITMEFTKFKISLYIFITSMTMSLCQSLILIFREVAKIGPDKTFKKISIFLILFGSFFSSFNLIHSYLQG